ncbi:hypothetical protein RYA05_03285 [Pseudomonas syringae pv. actinidiae]|nr:hypothetical protein [Pseudomonas syringae pv. actinidiae]
MPSLAPPLTLADVIKNPHVLAIMPAQYEIVAHRNLPASHQGAMVEYMACSGGAWELGDDVDSKCPESLSLSIERYGDHLMGVVTLSTEDVKAAIMKTGEIAEDFKTWDDYHKWYKGAGDVPVYDYQDRWPVILCAFSDEVLQDGWHRLHAYISAGHQDIPAIFYVTY